MSTPPSRRWAVAGLTTAAVVVGAAAPPAVDALRSLGRSAQLPAVTIGVDSASAEQVVQAEIYRQMFFSLGRDAEVRDIGGTGAGNAVDALRESGVDLTLACTGTLVAQLDRPAAEKLAGEMEPDAPGVADSEASRLTYDAAVGALPGGVATVDPSTATGCADAPGDFPDLPRNLIPLFDRSTFTRSETDRINFINRALLTNDVAEMADDVRRGEEPGAAVAEWLMVEAKMEVRDTPDTSAATDA